CAPKSPSSPASRFSSTTAAQNSPSPTARSRTKFSPMPERPKISGFAERILGVEKSRGTHPIVAFTEDDAGMVVQIPPSRITPNPDQPRHYFDKDALADLTESVRTRGVLQPIIVRRDKKHDGHFILIAGERRWRASKAAGLTKIPALIRSEKDDPAELALIENL